MASKASGKLKGSKSVAKGARKAVKAIKAVNKSAKKVVAKAAAQGAKTAKAAGKAASKLGAGKTAAPIKAKPKAVKKASKAQKLLNDVATLARSARKKLASVIDAPDTDSVKLKSITPFLNLKGAQDAIEFYKQAFGAEERYRMPNPDGTLMHAEIVIGDSRIMLAEASQAPQSRSTMHLLVDDCDGTFEKAVSAGASERSTPSDMFWGERIGEIEDPFGIVWSIATQVEQVAPDELSRRAQEFMNTASAPPPPPASSEALSTAE